MDANSNGAKRRERDDVDEAELFKREQTPGEDKCRDRFEMFRLVPGYMCMCVSMSVYQT
jgi:hypothetical protein